MSGMLYSFDVFDTLITRKVATPRGIFAILQEKLQHEALWQEVGDYIRDNFYWLRVNAEKLARAHYQHRGVEDVTLEQIYEALGTTGALDAGQQRRLAQLERDTECQYVSGIEVNIVQVQSLLDKGERVVLISDMYLDAATIRRMLLQASPIFQEIPLYVSSEYQKGKYTGNLYRRVQELEKVDFVDWVHVGDNPHSDVAVPRGLGIQVQPFDAENLLPIEQARLGEHENDAETQRLIGVARNIRQERKSSYSEILGANVGGPILFSYAAWILREAQKHDIRRLYFIARDGYIPKLIADKLIRAWNLSIETHYIYGSRKVWRMPSYEGTEGTLRRLVAWSYPERLTTPQKIADGLRIPCEKILPFLPEAYRAAGKSLRWEEINLCLWSLERQEAFRDMMASEMRPSRELARRYLAQEIDVSDEHFAFVDLGGSGLTQGCLANLMKSFCSYPVRTFFFKLDRINFAGNGVCYNFLPSHLEHPILIEMICRAPHGQTEAYEEQDGKVIPVLQQGEGDALLVYGYGDYIRGVEIFAEKCAEQNVRAVSLDFLLSYMQYLASFQEMQLTDYFADMPNTVSGREKEPGSFAPRLGKQMIRDLYLLHADDPKDWYYPGTDLALSKKRCSPAEKKKISRYEKHRETINERFKRLWGQPLLETHREDLPPMETLLFRFWGRIVIYGAGKYGQKMYKQCRENAGNVTAWLDREAERLKTAGLPVTGTIEKITELEFDTVYIAVVQQEAAKQIHEALLSYGVSDGKILSGPLWKCAEQIAHYLDVNWE